MRVAFFGSDAIALPALDFLHWHEGVELAAIISQPDRPAGRGRHLHANPVAAWARTKGIELLQPEKPGAEEAAWLKAQGVTLALVMAYGHILKRDLLETPPRGMWNLHASILPAYRGASPVEAALAAGDHETGVTLMRVTAKMDAGPVVGIERVTIHSTDTSPTLRDRMAQACAPLIERHLAALLAGTVQAEPQDESRVTYTRKLTKADAHLDFSAPTAVLERRIRAMQPWPGAAIEHDGLVIKTGGAAVLAENAAAEPGHVMRATNEGVDVATGGGVLRLLQLQRPGGRMMDAAEFLRGYRLKPGSKFTSHPMPPLVSPAPFPRVV